jgi:integrase
MARVKDLWFAEVPVKGPDGKTVKGPDGRAVKEKRKTAKHPDNGGSKTAKRWLACWTDPDGKEDTKAFPKKTDAKAHGEKMEADAERGEYIDPDAGKEKFGPLARKHLRLRAVGGSSNQAYDSINRNQVEPTFAHRSVKAIKPSEVLEWLRSPEISRLAGSTQLTAFLIVRGTFDLAVADKLRRDNPARSPIITPPRADSKRKESWGADRVWRVHDEHPEPYRPVVVCAAGLGTRQGEDFALAEEDFDFGAEIVHIRRQVERIGRQWVYKLPKGGKERTVPLARGVAAVVQACIRAYPPRPYELPWMFENGELADDPRAFRLLFRWYGSDPRTRDKHIQGVRYNDAVWKPALIRAGVIEPQPGRQRSTRYSAGSDGNGMHILRHFYSTTLQDAGISPIGVTEFMGHSLDALPVTFRVYGHTTEETFEQARDAIDKTLFKLRPVASGGTEAELRVAR